MATTILGSAKPLTGIMPLNQNQHQKFIQSVNEQVVYLGSLVCLSARLVWLELSDKILKGLKSEATQQKRQEQ